ncbi:MAG TPA: HAD family hydrolase, partial [Acidobacteria bacterium]|nr:HAD family hydrolase [Acidobacteriota bacterium]
MVGDRWRDVEAGRRAGCRTILLGAGYREHEEVEPDVRLDSIAEAAEWIL